MLIALLASYFVKVTLRNSDGHVQILLLLLISLITAFVVGFRGNSGTDTLMYRNVYENGQSGVNRWVPMEKGFILLCQIFKELHFSTDLFLIFISLITTFFILLAIRNEKEEISTYIASLIYFSTIYFQSFNIMRQTLALAICLYAFSLYVNRKYIVALIFILLATQIHTSAYMCLLIVLVQLLIKYVKAIKIEWCVTGLVIILLLLVMNRGLMGQIVLALTGNPYYAGYVLRNTGAAGSLLIYYLKISPVLIISTLEFNYYKNNHRFMVFYILMIIGYILASMGAYAATEVNRVGLYFTSLSIFVLGYCSKHNIILNKGKIVISKNIITTLIVIYYTFNLINGLFIQHNNQIVPYRSTPEIILNK